MSQSTDSKANKNTISAMSRTTTDNKMPSTIPKQGIKRYTSDEYEVESSAKKIRHQLNEEEMTGTIGKVMDAPKFINASQMINNLSENVSVIPEISDEELLQMAIKFEKENPQ